MFTGIVEAVGVAKWLRPRGGGFRLCVAFETGSGFAAEGDSVSVGGVCLTVAAVSGGECEFDVSAETAKTTTLGSARPPARVNIERALRADSRLGGHLVLGHVDGVGTVTGFAKSADSAELAVALPTELARCGVPRGSIAVDGVSLTIAKALPDSVRLVLIPETLARTTLGGLSPGDRVNVETDIIGKYVLKYAGSILSGRQGGVSEDLLRGYGYMQP